MHKNCESKILNRDSPNRSVFEGIIIKQEGKRRKEVIFSKENDNRNCKRKMRKCEK